MPGAYRPAAGRLAGRLGDNDKIELLKKNIHKIFKSEETKKTQTSNPEYGTCGRTG
jgi:hypothetical protein